MSDTVTFFVPGKPRTKGRPRMTRSGRVYTPKETIEAELAIAELWPGPDLLEGPLAMNVTYGPNGQLIDIRPDLTMPNTGLRGDIDNYGKLTLDGCQRSEAFNDRQITRLVLTMRPDPWDDGEAA